MPIYISPRATKLTTRQTGYLLDLSAPTIIKYIRLGFIPAEKGSSGNWLIDKKFVFGIRDECSCELGNRKWSAAQVLKRLAK